jgi:hypothetical protein
MLGIGFCIVGRVGLGRSSSHYLKVIDRSLQVPHSLFRRLSQPLNEKRKVDAMGTGSLDTSARGRM